ncbi:MAG TPA: hypothetical protein DIT65_06020 [Cryomorphaceae bacterium]|nr:hypothetical protein [Cryomorphaceae bacterium]
MNVALISRSTLYKQPGGDTVQVERTAEGLRTLGYDVSIVLAGQTLPKKVELIHGFNLGRPADLLPYFKSFKGKKVLSSVFVDYSLADKKRAPLAYAILGGHGMEWMKTILRGLNGSDRMPTAGYLFIGQRRSMKLLLALSDCVITSSMSEYERIVSWSASGGKGLRDKHQLIPLGIDDAFLQISNNQEGRAGLLMVGRLEYLKNQKTIIEWAGECNWPLTVVGDANVNQQDYYKACTTAAGPTITFLPYTNTNEIIRLMDEHQCLVVPSLHETYSLVGWEAAARGMAVVANKAADMSETLEPVAELVNIENKEDFIQAIEIGLKGQKKSQVPFKNFTWDAIISRIVKAYH